MKWKARRIWTSAVVMLVLAVGAYVAWDLLTTQRSHTQATSPDGIYVATVASTFHLTTHQFDLKVRNTSGQLVRHLVVHDKLPGWMASPTLKWSQDSRTVTLNLNDSDTQQPVKSLVVAVH